MFPSIDQISNRFNMVQHTDPLPSEQGEWVITVFKRKSRREFVQMKQLFDAYNSGKEEELQRLLLKIEQE